LNRKAEEKASAKGGKRKGAKKSAPEGVPVWDEAPVADALPILNRGYNPHVLVERTPQRGPRKFGWLEKTVESPLKWTAETPHLYRLVVTLRNPEGKVIEAVGSNVGFREVEIEDGQLRVNGVPVRLRGVNRHEHDPGLGHVMTMGHRPFEGSQRERRAHGALSE